nr:nose resistant to fluoxetine protein 6 [Halyomorpha halys]
MSHGGYVLWDATGRYSSQFFFGNDFWLGSKRLCSLVRGPYPFVFYQVRVSLDLGMEFTPQAREISLGVCLPDACSTTDLKTLIEATTSNLPNTVAIQRVRPVPGSYSILSDPKLHVLATIGGILIAMMTIGTAYEAILESRAKKFRKHRSNNNEGKMVMKKDEMSKSDEEMMKSMDPCHSMGRMGEMFLSFSILTNGRKILDCGAPAKDSLTCVHGLRFLSLAWVIMVHTYLQIFAIAENKNLRTLTEENFMFQTVANATFSVDSFFFISGLLVAYLFFKSSAKPDSDAALRTPRTLKPLSIEFRDIMTKFFTFLGYRFIRLTPAYMFVLGCAGLAMKWLKNNSVFEPISLDNVNCDKYWWRNMLYINSLYPRSEMCMLWSWYLANDTQFYLLGTLLLLLSSRFFRIAASSLVMILISSCVTCAVISVHYEHVVSVKEPFILFDQLYDKPWTRIGPYIAGLFTGWFLHKTKCSIRMSKCVALIGWSISLLVLGALVYGVLDANLGVTGSALYVSLGHTAWGFSLAWIVVACCCGYGGCINSLLSCRLLQPLSRLTYCAYLIHPVVMVMTSFQMEGPLHLHNLLVFILYFGNIVASFLISFFLSLMLEAPVVRLLKVLLTPMMKTSSSE